MSYKPISDSKIIAVAEVLVFPFCLPFYCICCIDWKLFVFCNLSATSLYFCVKYFVFIIRDKFTMEENSDICSAYSNLTEAAVKQWLNSCFVVHN